MQTLELPVFLLVCLPLVDSVGMEEQERERRRQVVEKFQKAPFEEIAAHCGARVQQSHLPSSGCVPPLPPKLVLSNDVFAVPCRPPYCRANSIRSLRLQSGLFHALCMFCFTVVTICNWQRLSLLPDPRRARLEPSRRAMARTRVAPCPSTRWSFQTFVSTRGDTGQHQTAF